MAYAAFRGYLGATAEATRDWQPTFWQRSLAQDESSPLESCVIEPSNRMRAPRRGRAIRAACLKVWRLPGHGPL